MQIPDVAEIHPLLAGYKRKALLWAEKAPTYPALGTPCRVPTYGDSSPEEGARFTTDLLFTLLFERTAFPYFSEISPLLYALAAFTANVTSPFTTRREACHWILSRLRLPTARLSATHDDLRVAGAPSNHVRCCDSSSLATGRKSANRCQVINS